MRFTVQTNGSTSLFDGLAKPKVAQHDPQEVDEKISEALDQPEGFPVGSIIEMFRSEEIRIEVKRVDVGNIESRYYQLPSNDLVLTRFDGERGLGLTDIDPFFWTVILDGSPPTEAMMEQLGKVNYAFKVDHVRHILAFKTER